MQCAIDYTYLSTVHWNIKRYSSNKWPRFLGYVHQFCIPYISRDRTAHPALQFVALAPLDFLSVSGETPCHKTGLVAFLFSGLDPLSRSSHGSSDKGTRPFPWILRALRASVQTNYHRSFQWLSPYFLKACKSSMSLDFHIFSRRLQRPYCPKQQSFVVPVALWRDFCGASLAPPQHRARATASFGATVSH